MCGGPARCDKMKKIALRQKPKGRKAEEMFAFNVNLFLENCPSDVPKEFRNIIIQCSELNPNKRPSLSSILLRLEKLLKDHATLSNSGNNNFSFSFESNHKKDQRVEIEIAKNYKAVDDVEISLKKGDKGFLLQFDDSGWCEAQFPNKSGWFPSHVLTRSSLAVCFSSIFLSLPSPSFFLFLAPPPPP